MQIRTRKRVLLHIDAFPTLVQIPVSFLENFGLIGRPAARITDMTIHLLPGGLTPGLPSKDVLIGGLAAWLGAPGGAGASLKDDKIASQKRILKATLACAVAGNTPQAKAALEALKIKEQAEMTKKIMDAAASGASVHTCVSLLPIPVGVPHGPGLVINGSPTVLINKLPACRIGDEILEAFGPKNFILLGQFNVLIGNKMTPTLSQLIANAIAAAKKLAAAALNLANLFVDLIGATPVVDFLVKAIRGAQNIAAKIIQLLGIPGARTRVSDIVKHIREDINGVIDGATKAIEEAVNDPLGTAADVASNVAHGVKKAAQDFKNGLEDAAQEELDKLRRMKENAGKIYDKVSDTIDDMAQDDGLTGIVGRELQKPRDAVDREIRGAKRIAEMGSEIADEGIDKARELKQEGREKVQEAKKAAQDKADEAAKKIGDLVNGFADSLDNTPGEPDDHHGHDHADATH